MTNLSFKLSDDFVSHYADKEPPFGFRDAGGNSVGEITFIRTYSRVKDDGTKERWHEVCERVINGMYTIEKDYVLRNKLPWSANKAQASAKEAYDRMFRMLWTPPGRGLHQMGAPQVLGGNSASLQNCAAVSTGDIDRYNPGYVFQWGMEALMNGVGLGADTVGVSKNIQVREPVGEPTFFLIPDTREGWAESVGMLINSYLRHNNPVVFDYSILRPAGAPIKTFGGIASGPGVLMALHNQIREMFERKMHQNIDSEMITDIFNMIGTCVIAGNTRRSAELIMGDYRDKDFLELKNPEVYPERNSYDPDNPGWAWACLPKSTWIHTEDGPKTVDQLIGNAFNVAVDGGIFKTDPEGFFSTGTRDVYRVSTKQGYEIDATSNHPVLTDNGFVAVEHLEVGDKVVISDQHVNVWGDNSMTDTARGYLLGSIWGDGWLTGKRAYVCLYGDEFSIERQQSIEGFAVSVGATIAKFQKTTSSGENRLASKVLFKLASEYGFTNKEKRIGKKIELESSEFYRAFLRAAFDADGTVAKYRSGAYGGQVILSQSHYKDLQAIQRMLLRLGIFSTIRKACSDYGYKNKRPPYTLAISARSLDQFATCIGFAHEAKKEKLSNVLASRKIVRDSGKTFYATIQSIDWVYEDEVFDVTVPTKHAFDANGIVVHNSNNSLNVPVGTDYSTYIDRIVSNGEPGFIWMDVAQSRGRMMDHPDDKDRRVVAFNPCSEQPLESFEMCTLTSIHLPNIESLDEFLRTLKFAFLYAKTVTLLPTPWPETNAVMQRNRRIGLSITGITDVLDTLGMPTIIKYMEAGYAEVRKWDKIYSEWLCVRESNRVTTVKPEGTISLLSGSSPGVHWGPGGKYFLRAIRFADNDKMLPLFRAANYIVEDDLVSANTQVVYFPVKSNAQRAENEVSMFEKIGLAAKAQNHWSDNGVSVTVSFDVDKEKDLIVPALRLHEGQLKSVSFLPMNNTYYPQMPYTSITEEEYNEYIGRIAKIDFSAIYEGVENLEAVGEKFCSNDSCLI